MRPKENTSHSVNVFLASDKPCSGLIQLCVPFTLLPCVLRSETLAMPKSISLATLSWYMFKVSHFFTVGRTRHVHDVLGLEVAVGVRFRLQGGITV